MTRLSLHYGDENPNLAIHLREGQYCTVGSSAAADYSFQSDGVEPVHCRIGCQASGGYIECFNVFASICINNVRKGRSRLAHGDKVLIGKVELTVDIPQSKTSLSNFAVEFELEDAPTTKVAGAIVFDHKREFEKGSSDDSSEDDSDDQANEEPAGNDSPIENESQPSAFDDEVDHLDDTYFDDDHPIDDVPDERSPSQPKSDSKPQFEFDSADPADIPMTQAEMDDFPYTEQVTIGMVDLEGELSKSDSVEINEAGSDSNESDSVFSGGTFVGKFWRWNGKRAVAVLKELIECEPDLHVYRSALNRVSLDQFGEISVNHLVKDQPAVFLLSSMKQDQLQTLVRQKRWDERIGHPQAVTMFLTFLPKRILDEFFNVFDACVLVNENDVELIRARQSY